MPDRSMSRYLYKKKTVYAPTVYRVNEYEDRCSGQPRAPQGKEKAGRKKEDRPALEEKCRPTSGGGCRGQAS